jgi:hypothetical protein
VATFLGSIPPVSSQHQLKHVRNAIDELGCLMTPQHRASLAIHEVTCNYSVSLEDVEDPATHFSLTQMFDGSLDSTKLTHVAHWSPELEIHMQYAKLNLYAMTFLLPPPPSVNLVDTQIVINRQTITLLGLESAFNLINHLKNISLLPVDHGEPTDAPKLVCYPKYYFANLVFAAVFIFRVLVVHGLTSQVHRVRGIQSLVEAHKILRLAPYHRDAARAAKILERFADMARSAGQSPLNTQPSIKLAITNRMGASLLWDTLPQSEFRVRGDAAAGRAPQVSECDESIDSKTEPLPLAPEMTQQLPDSLSFLGHPLGQDPGLDSWTTWDAYMNDIVLDTAPQITW